MVDLSKIHRIDEARHTRRQELEFMIRNRRNRLIGLSIAQRLGLDEKEAAAYATELVGEAIGKPGDDRLIEMLRHDLARAGVAIPDEELRSELDRFHQVAALELGGTGDMRHGAPRVA